MIPVLLPVWAVAVGLTPFRLGLGDAALLVPSLPLVGVLLCARRTPWPAYRIAALGGGLCAGLVLDGQLLLPAVTLLVLGGVAHQTRLLLPVAGFLGVAVLGIGYAAVELLVVHVLAGAASRPTLGLAEWIWAVGGLVLTGLCLAAVDGLVGVSPRLRHALERPRG